MSKSVGNFMTLHEALEQYEPAVLRFYLLSNHYRAPLEFNDDSLKSAQAAVQRIGELARKKTDTTISAQPAIQTIGEAMASGCVVVTQHNALKGVLPESLMPQDDSDEAASQALRASLALSEQEKRDVATASRAYIEREHSLNLLIERLSAVFGMR